MSLPPTNGAQVLTWRVEDLRPTQMTVGFREVAQKRRDWRAAPASWRAHTTLVRATPTVLGRGPTAHVLDRHHTLCALSAEGVGEITIAIVDDLGHLDEGAFWRTLMRRRWCHPFDAAGVRRPCRSIPNHFADLADDPFRSLAGALRRGGGYAKTVDPFSEFQWAAYLRRHISSAQIEADFAGALRMAHDLATQPTAMSLPGRERLSVSQRHCKLSAPQTTGQ